MFNFHDNEKTQQARGTEFDIWPLYEDCPSVSNFEPNSVGSVSVSLSVGVFVNTIAPKRIALEV